MGSTTKPLSYFPALPPHCGCLPMGWSSGPGPALAGAPMGWSSFRPHPPCPDLGTLRAASLSFVSPLPQLLCSSCSLFELCFPGAHPLLLTAQLWLFWESGHVDKRKTVEVILLDSGISDSAFHETSVRNLSIQDLRKFKWCAYNTERKNCIQLYIAQI